MQTQTSEETAARQIWMGLLARAETGALAALLPEPLSPHALLRGPEIGAVMVQGRAGGTGDAFNLGEMTVTRCSLRLAGGAVGHAVVPGRSADHARRAALVDALMQTDEAAMLRARVLEPLSRAEVAAAAQRAAKAAATQVEFFTMIRGEDA